MYQEQRDGPPLDADGQRLHLGDEVLILAMGNRGKEGRIVKFGWDDYESLHVAYVDFLHTKTFAKYTHNLRLINNDYTMDIGL